MWKFRDSTTDRLLTMFSTTIHEELRVKKEELIDPSSTGRLEFQVVDLNVKSFLGLKNNIIVCLESIGPEVHNIQHRAP